MDSVAEGFEYNNGVWKTTWHSQMGREIKLFVICYADLRQSQSVPLQLEKLLNSIDDSIDKASTFACDSEYRDDISLAGGMVVDSVVVNKWDEVKVWTYPRKVGARKEIKRPARTLWETGIPKSSAFERCCRRFRCIQTR